MIKDNIFSLKFLFLTIKALSQFYIEKYEWRGISGEAGEHKISCEVAVRLSSMDWRNTIVSCIIWCGCQSIAGGPTWGRRGVTRIMLFTRRRGVLSLRSLPPMCYGDSSRCRYEGSPMVFGRFVPASPTSSTRLLRLEFNRAIPVTRGGTWRSINSRVI